MIIFFGGGFSKHIFLAHQLPFSSSKKIII
jgi:hypothetical protein